MFNLNQTINKFKGKKKEKVALIIIYNHRYDRNIDVLERIYNKRFSNIFHLMPFYDGSKSNVIPVYENSHYFQGYIAQGAQSFYSDKYSHYLFVADDLILNPVINEENYIEYFNLDNTTSFIPELITLHERKEFWHRVRQAYEYSPKKVGVEVVSELPSYDEAIKRFSKFGLRIGSLSASQMYREKPADGEEESFEISYPLVGAYSDITVVSANCIKQFCHYCGVFSATDLFVELAIPTSLILSTEKIVTERDLSLQGKALWVKNDFEVLRKYDNNLNMLLSEFPEGYLYLHPVKLSEWIV